jgi:hypothetical protein
MRADLDALEKLVDRAVRRIGELERENRELLAEAAAARERAAAGAADAEARDGWRRERSAVLTGLREALAELREGA